MPHLLIVKYTPPASAQTQKKIAIALFIVSVLITFDSIDGAEPLFGRAERREAHIKFRKSFVRDKLLQKALQSLARYRSPKFCETLHGFCHDQLVNSRASTVAVLFGVIEAAT
jgi:hypothetical protein